MMIRWSDSGRSVYEFYVSRLTGFVLACEFPRNFFDMLVLVGNEMYVIGLGTFDLMFMAHVMVRM